MNDRLYEPPRELFPSFWWNKRWKPDWDRPLILVDRHHADLYHSHQRLFERRLGFGLVTPLGHEWWDEGYWRFGEVFGDDRLAAQYLAIDAKWWEQERGVYVMHDPAHPRDWPIVGMTLERARTMPWLATLATVQENQAGLARFAREHDARYLYHIGNTRQQVDWSLDPFALVAAEAPLDGRGCLIGEEIDDGAFGPFRFRDPVHGHFVTNRKRISSFVNLMPRIPEVASMWAGARALMPEFTFTSYGHDCPDGNLHPVEAIAAQMAMSGWGWHDKPTGDGFGHIIHNWAAIGRPLIGHARYYRGQRAEPLWQDLTTCVDLDLHPLPEAIEIIRAISADPEAHALMCRNIRQVYAGLVDWQGDAERVREGLS